MGTTQATTKATSTAAPDGKSDPATGENHAGEPGFENEGEGSRTAGRRYNEATEAYVKSGRAEPAANAAKKALEGSEGDDLRAAEAKGKEGEPDT